MAQLNGTVVANKNLSGRIIADKIISGIVGIGSGGSSGQEVAKGINDWIVPKINQMHLTEEFVLIKTYFNFVKDNQSFEATSSKTLTGSIEASKGDIIVAVITTRSALTLPESLTLLHTSDAFSSGNQLLTFAYMEVTEDGTYSFTMTQASSARLYLDLICLTGVKSIKYIDDLYYHNDGTSTSRKYTLEKEQGKMLLWACSCYNMNDGYTWTVEPNDMTGIFNSRQAIFVDVGTSADSHTFIAPITSSTTTSSCIDAIEIYLKE